MHNRASNTDRIPVIQLYIHVKQSAATTDQPSSSIINSALTTFVIHAVGELPKNENTVQTIRQQRTKTTVKSNGFLPEELKKTYHGERFLLYEDNKMIILTTKSVRFSLGKKSLLLFSESMSAQKMEKKLTLKPPTFY